MGAWRYFTSVLVICFGAMLFFLGCGKCLANASSAPQPAYSSRNPGFTEIIERKCPASPHSTLDSADFFEPTLRIEGFRQRDTALAEGFPAIERQPEIDGMHGAELSPENDTVAIGINPDVEQELEVHLPEPDVYAYTGFAVYRNIVRAYHSWRPDTAPLGNQKTAEKDDENEQLS